MRYLAAISLIFAVISSLGCGEEAEPTATPAAENAASEGATGDQAPADPHAGLDRTQPSGGPSGGPPVGGVGWDVPQPFRAQPPASRMRAAEYVFPEEPGETAGTMTVFFFGAGQGGSVEANIARWVGQFTLPEGVEPRIERSEVNGLAVTTIDLTGRFGGGMGEEVGGPPQERRLLGAIVEGPSGPVFFKMVAEVSLMERAHGPFEQLVASFHPS